MQPSVADTTAAHTTVQSGNLVDDILNGAYSNEHDVANQHDNLLDDDDHALDDLEHLN